ncbi:hypothetical protein N431DRAFT_433836 [Stipitochalara longipes BDJ]|nr:hypothetical protein N431DRAFT_433836 [Stipitochalara longipes BDJ]
MSNKKALLIASQFKGLKGPANDVSKMDKVLRDLGFEISCCDGTNATYDGILQAWHQLIDTISPEDSVIVYYSGHGGSVKSVENHDRNVQESHSITPWRYQFLVPVDFDDRQNGDFRGILDVELSCLLQSMTDKTRNVTIILDCCYAGRMARDPSFGDAAVSKSISRVLYPNVLERVNRLRVRGRFQQETHVEENPFVVRIAAAAASETAWEYENERGEWCGVMTEALIHAISESKDCQIPWRTTLLRVSELVNVRFPYQHPQVEGPGDRLHFSVQERVTGAFHIRNENDRIVIQGGRVSRVREGNVYSVMPFGMEKAVVEKQLAEARVTHATAFKATAELLLDQRQVSRLPTEGALAFLQSDALYKWPVGLPSSLLWLRKMIHASRYIRPEEPDGDDVILAEFQEGPDGITLHSNRGVVVAAASTEPTLDDRTRLLDAAEQLARAQHLLSLRNETLDDVLEHDVEVRFGIVGKSGGLERIIRQDGADSVSDNDRVYIELNNHGTRTVYVWVFDVNAAGKITRVSRSSPKGIELPPGRNEVLGASRYSPDLRGLPVSWPKVLSRARPVEETLLFILSDSSVDLNHLADQGRKLSSERMTLSKLEQLTYRISSGESRDITLEEDDDLTRYTMIHIPFLLFPNASEK